MSEIKLHWMALTADQTLWRKILVNLRTSAIETVQNETHRGKKTNRLQQSISELWDNRQWPYLRVNGVVKGGDRKKYLKK